ncbi:YesL family protein [Lederbergia lenta]|uniref:Putative membrane enzyme for rhamnogalaturonan degradation n=1 Tax=Lederbergia lenta TaxID=1467 RepID=A0A2X4WPN4_LEDLE|nr:YesL family protein [Lederbergia lenta]MCM3110352.1 YesL family protein [Lederbergia lenta]MEC2324080.1 YesL family protein [Lederbergia lenta]SQI60652.1 putative membrane enzyme for rhamnogalaturonan degradation [Lederbergia lenta]
MQMGGIMGGFYRISEWIWRFFYINILWIMFLIPGLLIFGFFPSTAAMFAVMRKWVQGESDIPVFKTFWTSYKKEFIKSNILGLIIAVIGYILFIDLKFIQVSTNSFVSLLHIPLIAVFLLYGLVLLYIFPVFVHYDIKMLQVFKNSFLIMIMFPFITIMMAVVSYFIYYIMLKIPGLIPIFGGSIIAYAISWGTNITFRQIEQREVARLEKEKEQKASDIGETV